MLDFVAVVCLFIYLFISLSDCLHAFLCTYSCFFLFVCFVEIRFIVWCNITELTLNLLLIFFYVNRAQYCDRNAAECLMLM